MLTKAEQIEKQATIEAQKQARLQEEETARALRDWSVSELTMGVNSYLERLALAEENDEKQKIAAAMSVLSESAEAEARENACGRIFANA